MEQIQDNLFAILASQLVLLILIIVCLAILRNDIKALKQYLWKLWEKKI